MVAVIPGYAQVIYIERIMVSNYILFMLVYCIVVGVSPCRQLTKIHGDSVALHFSLYFSSVMDHQLSLAFKLKETCCAEENYFLC